MSNSMTLAMMLMLKDMASGPLSNFQNKVKNISQTLMGVGAASKMMGTNILNGLKVPIAAFSEAEDAGTRLKTSMMGIGGAVDLNFPKVNDLALQLGNKLPGTTADFQNMFTVLKQQGVPSQGILGGIGKASAYLAVQLKMGYEEAAKFSSKVAEAAGIADKDMMSFMDTIQRTANLGVETSEMQYAFGRSAGALKNVKMQGLESAQAMSVLYAQLIKTGLSGETVGTNFAGLLDGLKKYQYGIGDKATSAKNSLKDLGIEMQFFDKAGKFVGPRQFIQQLEKLNQLAPDKKAKALDSLFGGGQDGQMVASLMSGGVKAYDLMSKRMKEQADLNTKVEAQLKTLKNIWDSASGTFTNLMATMGESIAPELKAMADGFGKLSENIQKFAKEHPQITKMATGLALMTGSTLAVGGTAVMGLGMATSALGPLGNGLSLVSGKSTKLKKDAALMAFNMRAWNLRTKAWALSNAQAAGGAINALPGKISAKSKALATAAQGGIISLPGKIRAWTSATAAAASGAITKIPGLIRAQSAAMWAGVGASAAWVRANLLTVTGLKGLAAAGWGKIVGGFRAVAMGIRAMSLAALANPIGLIAIGIVAAALLIYKFWGPISGFFKGLWRGLMAGLAPLKPAFAKAFAGMAPILNPIIGVLKAVWNAIKSLLSPMSDVGNNGQKMGVRVGLALAQMINKGIEVLSFFGSMASKFASFGANMMSGLLSGIMAGAGKVLSYVTGLASKISGAFANAMGIKSPSRVFMSFGKHLGTGLELGMKSKNGQILAAASLMAKSATPKFQPQSVPISMGGISPKSTAGSGGHQITFAPIIQLGSNAGESAKQQVQEALGLSYIEFKRFMDRYEHDKKRVSA